ncbi:MAG: hypothetical protein HY801_12425 [Candidatus Lindowbacteria bacterium]|nr:hypothetical protein [Candidatus Lindowbacteria bacterium]
MKRLVTLGVWYCVFLATIYIVSDRRGYLEPIKEKIVYLSPRDVSAQRRDYLDMFIALLNSKPRIDEPLEDTLYLIGDCTAYNEPSSLPRMAIGNLVIEDIPVQLSKIPCAYPEKLTAHFVVMAGTRDLDKIDGAQIEERILALEEEIRHRFPNSEVTVISPCEIAEIAKKHSSLRDNWHLSAQGYKILWARHFPKQTL